VLSVAQFSFSHRLPGRFVTLHCSTSSAGATEQPSGPIAALAERLAVQLLAAGKRKPYILDLSLVNDQPCPLGNWLADRLSEALLHAHPELEVIARGRWNLAKQTSAFAHDRNEEYAQNEQRAQSLGAEVLVQGDFAAVPGGIGITLIASDRLAGGESRFEALAEIPVTSEMQAVLTTLCHSALNCKACQIRHRRNWLGALRELSRTRIYLCGESQEIARRGDRPTLSKYKWLVENVKIVRTPNPALSDAAIRSVRSWRFSAARNAQGQCVPVFVDVAVAFRLEVTPSGTRRRQGTRATKSVSVATAKATARNFSG